MDKYYFDENNLMAELQTMSYERVLAFGAACSERLLPNYRKFVETEQWGDYSVLRSALDHIWKIVFHETNISADIIKTIYEKVDKLTPDADDFSGDWCSPAIDAGCSILGTLEYCLNKDLKHVIWVASYARDTVWMFVSGEVTTQPYNNKLEIEIIDNDPRVMKEIKKQIDDLKILKAQSEYNIEFLKQFQQLAYNKSNIEFR